VLFLEILAVTLLGYQVVRPESYNAKFSYTSDEHGLIRFNTQDGSAVRCTKDLICQEPKEKKDELPSPTRD
jgi:hypothetical protein